LPGHRNVGPAGSVPYSRAIADEIIDWLVEGKSLKSFCEQPGKPSRKVIYEWIEQDRDSFAGRYDLARRLGAESWADEMDDLTASDIDCNSMARVAARKNQIASRQWLMSRLYPSRFGDRVEVSVAPRVYDLPAGHPDGSPDHATHVMDGGRGVQILLPVVKRHAPVVVEGTAAEILADAEAEQGEGDG
jgi:hypothetical protein